MAGAQHLRFLLGNDYGQEDHEHSGKGVPVNEHMVDSAEQDYEPAVSCGRSQQNVSTYAAGGGETYA
jgi:hypothetical protein